MLQDILHTGALQKLYLQNSMRDALDPSEYDKPGLSATAHKTAKVRSLDASSNGNIETSNAQDISG